MRLLRLEIAEWLPQNLREFGASRILDHLLLALAILPLALIYASFSLCSTRARALHLRWCAWTAAYSSSSSASPAERSSGDEPNARLGVRGGGGRAALGGRASSRTTSRVATAGDKATLSSRYTFLVLFQ